MCACLCVCVFMNHTGVRASPTHVVTILALVIANPIRTLTILRYVLSLPSPGCHLPQFTRVYFGNDHRVLKQATASIITLTGRHITFEQIKLHMSD